MDLTKYFPILGSIEHPSDLLAFVTANPNEMDKNKFMCKICGKTSVRSAHVRNHVENIHFPNNFIYNCHICSESLKSQVALQNHVAKHLKPCV